MNDQNLALRNKRATRSQILRASLYGILPYAGGFLVIITRNIWWLALAGASICFVSTAGTYFLRRTLNPEDAKPRLLADPMLYAFEFLFTAVIIRYVFMR